MTSTCFLRHEVRAATLLISAALILAGLTSAAAAQFSTLRVSSSTVRTLVIGAASSASASTQDACATVDVTWQRALGADTYDLHMQVDAESWQLVAADLGNVESTTSAAAPAGTDVSYRITPRHAASGWTGAPTISTALHC